MVTHQVDGFKIPHGDDTHYISREYQLGALSLEKDGRPFRISTTKNTSIYLVVRHEHHEAPAHLVLSPFTAPLYPNQTFYGVHIQYTRCCDQGPNLDAITKTLRRVYDVLFPLGECRFDEHNQQEVHVGALAGLSCHDRAQRGLDRLQQGLDSALKRQLNDSSHTPYDSAIEAPIGRSQKRRRHDGPGQGGLPTLVDSRQDNPQQDSPQQDNPQQDSPQQDNPQQDNPQQDSPQQDSPQQDSPQQDSPQQDSPQQYNREKATGGSEQDEPDSQDAQILATKATEGLAKLRVKDKGTGLPRDVDFVAKLPVQFSNGYIQVKEHNSRYCTQDSAAIWEFAREHCAKAKDIKWLLCLVSSCLSMVEAEFCKTTASLGTNQDRTRLRWINGISMLNRVIDQVGFMGLRLYDAYGVKHFYFAQYAKKAHADRNRIADLVAEQILKEGISAHEDSHVFYIPYLVWSIFHSKYKERPSQAKVCEILGLESFAEFRVDSPFISLHELYEEQMRLENSRPNIPTGRLLHKNERKISVVNVSRPVTAALDTGAGAVSSGSRSGSESAESHGCATPNETSRRPKEPPTQHSIVEPSDEVSTTRKDLGPSCAQQLSTPQECLSNQPRASLPPPSGPELNGPELPHHHSERLQQPQDQESARPQVTTVTEFTVPTSFSPWTPGPGPCSENTEPSNQSLSHQATGYLRPLQQQNEIPDRPSSQQSSNHMAIRNILGGPPDTQPHQSSSITGISEQPGSMRFQDPITNGIQLSLGNDTDMAAGQEPTASSSQGGYSRQPAFYIDDLALSVTFGTLFEIDTDDLFMDQNLPFLDLNNQ